MLTVVTPAKSRLLTTVPAARDHLLLGDDVDETYLRDLIAQASAAIVSHCRRAFARETVRETFRPRGSAPLILDRTPVAGAVTLTVAGQAVDADGTELNTLSGLLYRLDGAARWTAWGCDATAVEYTGGYALPGEPDRDLPADIEEACLIMVAARHAARGRDPMLRSETTEGVGSASFIATADMSGMPPQAAALLEPYRRWVVA
ncbi:head-tail connector protein [Roseomonas elaeocarpi]|uniref:Phage gp6-like head-tail connector protein n=1 Tax=Roseomonas elaeocarpi TaxID=907779 RepID=A0ABV6JZ17_9PROT